METTNLKNTLSLRRAWLPILSMGLMLTLLVSCNPDDETPDFTAADEESAAFESKDDSYFDDADGVVTEAWTGTGEEGGRISTDERLACATVTLSGTKESGELTIDFGDGCTGPRGHVRKGIIRVERMGVWNVVGSYWIITFEGYSINGVGLEGTRTVKVISATDLLLVHEITLVGGKIIWPDGRIGTREVERRREHVRDPNHLLDRLIIYGTAQGTLCNGRGYTIEIIEPLVYDRTCATVGVSIPVKGVKLIKHGGRELTVDYGDGTCDNMVTLTNKNGRSIRYEIKP